MTPYNFLWNDGNTLQNRTTLNHGNKSLTLTDANGCELNAELLLLEPASADWMMGGNENTDPATQFIGTKDSTDVVFRTNNQEHLRLDAAGNLKVKNLESTVAGLDLLFVDANGMLQRQINVCQPTSSPWLQGGNTITSFNATDRVIGTCSNHDFNLVTNSQYRISITPSGLVGIGTTAPSHLLTVHGNASFLDAVNPENAFQLTGGTQLPAERGIGVPISPDESLNFYVNSATNNATAKFNFRDGAVSGTPMMTIGYNEHIGIGNASPVASLQLGDVFVLNKGTGINGVHPSIGFNITNNPPALIDNSHPAAVMEFDYDGNILFKGAPDDNNGQVNWNPVQTKIFNDGKIFIGEMVNGGYHNSYPPGHTDCFLLAVDGKILSKEVRVKTSNWPDYVFSKNYPLYTIDNVASFIYSHGHLPDVPSAGEVESKGHDLGAMDALLLKKVEELTLYVIDLDKRNKVLEQEIRDLKVLQDR